MVVRIRSNFCQYTMLWERLEQRESGGKHCLERSLEDVDEAVVADLYLLGSVGTGCEISKLWKGVLT